ncbi:MAG: D-aminoacylase [Chloroflexota bacterium]|nr:D-aminoacylase [Chloroflexota bacterium]
MTSFHTVLAGGQVVDGTGAPAYRADIGLEGGRIVAVGDLSTTEAGVRIDASDRVVCPGFIDMHSHSDLTLLVQPTGDSKVQQGVTTEVNGNCGFSPAPLTEAGAPAVMQLHAFFGNYVRELGWDWRTPDEYITRLGSDGLSHHVALLVGHATLRIDAMGMQHRPPTAAELAHMRDLVRASMRAGYFGMSSGLVTPPSVYADTDELAELATVVAQDGGLYATHMRGEGHSLLRATAEALEIGERSGARVQISHHKATFRPYWGRIRQAMQLSEWAAERGQRVGFDVYPYTAGSANLTQIIPDWAHEGGLQRLLERLRDPAPRERIRADVLVQNREWDQTFVAWLPTAADQTLTGQSIAAIAERRGGDPIDTLFGVLDESSGEASMVHFAMDEQDVRLVMRHPLSMFGSDGLGLAPTGVLSQGQPHPRCYGTYPRILGRYVREEHVLSLEDAVRKASFLPAETLGLPNKGRVQAGADGDIVVFDPGAIEDRATYQQPHQFPVGIDYVLVGGEIAVDHGQVTPARAGKVLRRR